MTDPTATVKSAGQDRVTDSAAPAAHLEPWVWEYVGDLRDHLGRDHKRRAEMLVGLDRFALMDLHKELHGG